MPTTKTAKKVTAKKVKKTPVKKVVSKKGTTKKSAPKNQKFKALVCAYDGECFWSRDGRILENLADLQLAIGAMDDEIFLHHTEGGKNDFADWVQYVLQDADCAEDLRKTSKKKDAEKIITQHLRTYNIQ